MRRNLGACIAVMSGILASCLVAELALRIIYPLDSVALAENDEASGLLHYAPHGAFEDISSCYDNRVEVNSMGFHGREFVETDTRPVYRIALVGGSFVEAAQVPTDAMLSSVLEDELNATPSPYHYQVVPIGFSGNGTYLNQLYYLRWGAPLRPDLVIDLSTEYEIGKASAGQLAPDGTIVPLAVSHAGSASTDVKNLLRRSRLVMNLYSRYLLLKANKTSLFAQPAFMTNYATPAPTDALASWDVERKLLSSFAKTAQTDGARFVLASWMSRNAASTTARELPRKMADAASADGYSYIDLDGSIASSSATTGTSAVWSCDEHWSAAGHRFAADAIYAYLHAYPALLEKKP